MLLLARVLIFYTLRSKLWVFNTRDESEIGWFNAMNKRILLFFIVGLFCKSFVCAQDEKAIFGSDILLVVHFNHAHYDNVEFLKGIYKSYFPHIVFYGEQEHEGLHVCQHNRGYYGYKTLAHAMQMYPNYRGYLYVHDDCIINPWNLSRLDKNKIWFVSGAQVQDINTRETNPHYGWWAHYCGIDAAQKVLSQLPARNLNMLEYNVGESNVVFVFSDLVYIPAQYKDDFIALSTLSAKERFFLEIAIPTICCCLDKKENWQILNGLTWWWWLSDNDRLKNQENNMKECWSADIDFIHPIKFSDQANRKYIQEQFDRIARQ